MQAQRQSGVQRGGLREKAGRTGVGARGNQGTPFLTQGAIDRVEQWRTSAGVGFNTALNQLLVAWRQSEPGLSIPHETETLHDQNALEPGLQATHARSPGIKKSVALWDENLSWVHTMRLGQERMGQTLSRLIVDIPPSFVPPEPKQKGPWGGPRIGARRLGGTRAPARVQKNFTISEYGLSRVQERQQQEEKFSQAVRRLLEELIVPADFDSAPGLPPIEVGRRRKKSMHLSPYVWELLTHHRRERDGNSTVLSRLLETLPPLGPSPGEDAHPEGASPGTAPETASKPNAEHAC